MTLNYRLQPAGPEHTCFPHRSEIANIFVRVDGNGASQGEYALLHRWRNDVGGYVPGLFTGGVDEQNTFGRARLTSDRPLAAVIREAKQEADIMTYDAFPIGNFFIIGGRPKEGHPDKCIHIYGIPVRPWEELHPELAVEFQAETQPPFARWYGRRDFLQTLPRRKRQALDQVLGLVELRLRTVVPARSMPRVLPSAHVPQPRA